MARVELYSSYERIWHWLQALGIILLILTGFLIHYPGGLTFFPYDLLVSVHNLLGFLFLINAFLGFFYSLTSGSLKQYLPRHRDFFTLTVEQVTYYTRGIFRGDPHPMEKSKERRLNPLQQITYLILLNVLLPLQMLTGILMWGAQKWPETLGKLGGLSVLGTIHSLGAWFFASFLIMHVYLTTTGHTPLTNIKAMVTGYEEMD